MGYNTVSMGRPEGQHHYSNHSSNRNSHPFTEREVEKGLQQEVTKGSDFSRVWGGEGGGGVSLHEPYLVVQRNLSIMDILGPLKFSLIWRLPYYGQNNTLKY